MSAAGNIRYLRRQEIDTRKWDACIEGSPHGLIYGRSFYLDHMTEANWDALVLDDYAAVMPLTWNRKWGIRYLYQPPFTQQLGVFWSGGLPLTPAAGDQTPPLIQAVSSRSLLLEQFLTHIPRHFRFAEIFLNYANPLPGLQAHPNFILDLDAPYSTLSSGYKKDLIKNLKLAERTPMKYSVNTDLRIALKLHKESYGERFPHVKEEDYRRFEKLCLFLQGKDQLILRSAIDRQGQLLAIALLPVDKKRLYLLQSTTLPAGRETAANHFLLDGIIREFADRPLILDFEGSSLPGIAHFYANFGARDQPYFFYRHNRLAWPLRLLK